LEKAGVKYMAKTFTKTLFKVTNYTSIRIMYNSKTDYIFTYLNICRLNKKLIKLNYNKSKQIIQRLKTNGCAKCGYDTCNSALEFHHVNPENKKFLIGKAFIAGHSNERITEELNKCILLCCRCHREIEELDKFMAERKECSLRQARRH
jgi:hypothetical protein